ncbi:unnamed protein product [Closterium sp. NIES-65]|nr:unnamed protein product [Closterium sp. NIES-65]
MADKNHPNIVKLLGFAIGGDLRTQPEQVLIYECVPNGDLNKWIGLSEAVVSTGEAVVSTGEAVVSTGEAVVCTGQAVVYTATLQPVMSKDRAVHEVYSFGVLMLVVLTGQAPVLETDGESRQITPRASTSLSKTSAYPWIASECLSSGDMGSLKDPTMDAPADGVLRVAQLALSCTVERTAARPSMAHVANELQAIREEWVGKEELSAAVKVDTQVQEMKDVVGLNSLDTELQMIEDNLGESYELKF